MRGRLRRRWLLLSATIPCFMAAPSGAQLSPTAKMQLCFEGLPAFWDNTLRGLPKACDATIVPALVTALKRGKLQQRDNAFQVLRLLGPQAEAAMALLVKDIQRGERASATEAEILSSIGPSAIPALLPLLNDHRPQVRLAAADALGGMGARAAVTVPALAEALFDRDDWSVRRSAAFALARIGPPAAAVIPQLLTALKQEDVVVRRSTAAALGNIGAPAAAASPELIALLSDADAEVRRSVVVALGKISAEPKAAVPALVRALKDITEVRAAAIVALRAFGPEAAPAVPVLTQMLQAAIEQATTSQARQQRDRFAAALQAQTPDEIVATLATIGPQAAPAMPVLITAFKHKALALDTARANSILDFRSEPARALVSIGAPSIPPLRQILEHEPNLVIRSNAASALVQLHPPSAQLVPLLLKLLKEPDNYARLSAAEAIAILHPDDRELIATLLVTLGEQEGFVNATLSKALASIGQPALATLIVALKDPNPRIRAGAALAIAQMCLRNQPAAPPQFSLQLGPSLKPSRETCAATVPAIPTLIAALDDQDESVRRMAGYALSNIGAPALSALKAQRPQSTLYRAERMSLLRQLEPAANQGDRWRSGLQDADPTVRCATAIAIAQNPQADDGAKQAALQMLMPDLQSQDWHTRENTAYRLLSIPSIPPAVIPALVKQLLHNSGDTRSGQALNQLGTAAVPTLIAALQDADPKTRSQAASALGTMGVDAETALPALKQALQDPNAAVQIQAAYALASIDPDSRTAAALVLVQSLTNPTVRAQSLRLLSFVSTNTPLPEEAVPVLISALHDPKQSIRLSAIDTLGNLGAAAAPAVAAISQALQTEKDGVLRAQAAEALQKLGTVAAPALPALLQALSDREGWVSANAATALGSLGAAAAGATPKLITLLQDPSESTRRSAAWALGQIGPAAKPAIPALQVALKDQDDFVRDAAANAIRMILRQP